MAESSSKDLLQLEGDSTTISSTSCLESKLFVCKKDGGFSQSEAPLQKPTMFPVPRSQVLGKVKDFLGVISESNKKLLHDSKDNPNNYDIEVLSGKESEVIQMDLMVGVTDLHTPEAVAAAESAIAGYQSTTRLSGSSSESENEDGSDKDDDNGEDKINEQDQQADVQTVEFGSKNTERDNSSCKKSRKEKPKKRKRPKIVELS